MNRIRLDWVGLVLIMWSALTRAAVGAEPLPGWDADPTRTAFALIGNGPTGSLILDLLAWVGAAFVFASIRNKRGLDPLALLGLIGAVAVFVRTLVVDGTDVEAIRIGSSWAAGWVSFAAVLTQAHRPLVRSVVGAITVGFVLYLCSKAFVQTFVEHPHMLAQFDANREASLIGQGFEPGTPQAMIYERRLRQPDPTGWFGLSNVLASFLAAGTVMLACSGVGSRRGIRCIAAVAALVAFSALLLTGSKAGLAVTALGAGLVLAVRFLPARFAPIACAGALAVPPAAVIFRGLSGIPNSELSLLVRWFYMQGAWRISGQQLPLGTGPNGFQQAYMLAKPPQGTEDVISPHMIWLDYSATLGLVALPLLAALLWVIFRLGRTLSVHRSQSHAPSPQRVVLTRPVVLLVLLMPVLVGAWLEMQATPMENALARLVGVLAWGGLALLLIRSGLPTARVLAIGAVVLLAHAELDMNMSLPGSAPLVLMLVGLACSTRVAHGIQIPQPIPAVVGLALSLWLGVVTIGIWAWESDLREASTGLREIAQQRDDLLAAGAQQWEVAHLQDEFMQQAIASLSQLESAYQRMPGDDRVAHAGARLAMTISGSAFERVDRARTIESAERAETILTKAIQEHPTSSLLTQRASVRLWLVDVLKDGPVRKERLAELRTGARADGEQAAALAPYNHRPAVALALMLSESGDVEGASTWAREALSRDALSELDPLSGMSDSLRQRLEEMILRP